MSKSHTFASPVLYPRPKRLFSLLLGAVLCTMLVGIVSEAQAFRHRIHAIYWGGGIVETWDWAQYTTACPEKGMAQISAEPLVGGYLIKCKTCAPGTYNNSLGGSCRQCSAGSYSSSTGATSCTKCQAGYYSSSGATTCSACWSGTYSSTGASSCSTCRAGTYSHSGASSCTSCKAGTYSKAGATRCTGCPVGTYSTSSSSASCQSCPSGYTSPSYSSSSSCLRCVVQTSNGGCLPSTITLKGTRYKKPFIYFRTCLQTSSEASRIKVVKVNGDQDRLAFTLGSSKIGYEGGGKCLKPLSGRSAKTFKAHYLGQNRWKFQLCGSSLEGSNPRCSDNWIKVEGYNSSTGVSWVTGSANASVIEVNPER